MKCRIEAADVKRSWLRPAGTGEGWDGLRICCGIRPRSKDVLALSGSSPGFAGLSQPKPGEIWDLPFCHRERINDESYY